VKPYCTESKKEISPSKLDTKVSFEDNPDRSGKSIKKQREDARFMRRYEKKRVRKRLDQEMQDELDKHYQK
jgi:hypothetical protein